MHETSLRWVVRELSCWAKSPPPDFRRMKFFEFFLIPTFFPQFPHRLLAMQIDLVTYTDFTVTERRNPSKAGTPIDWGRGRSQERPSGRGSLPVREALTGNADGKSGRMHNPHVSRGKLPQLVAARHERYRRGDVAKRLKKSGGLELWVLHAGIGLERGCLRMSMIGSGAESSQAG